MKRVDLISLDLLEDKRKEKNMISSIIGNLMLLLGIYLLIKSIYILIKIKRFNKYDTVLIAIYFMLFISFNITEVLCV